MPGPSLTADDRPVPSRAAAVTATATAVHGHAPLEPMDPQLTCIQPGGGVVIRIEQAWGRLRRWYLKRFRAGYVDRMRQLRRGDVNPCPHEVLDPRDLKFHRNQLGYHWLEADDPFTWRDRLPFARVGLAELLLLVSMLFVGAAGLMWLAAGLGLQGWAAYFCRAASVTFVVCGLLVGWFFRDPRRIVPQAEGLVVAPADGKVVAIDEIEDDEFIGGPAICIGIFLSIFNVHVNRMPIGGRVIGLRYRPGKCLNALRPESARENERLTVCIQAVDSSHRRMMVRQITGAIARRIVCWLKPGDVLTTGEQFGMIKLGSRTELVLPVEDGLEIKSRIGDCVKAGSSVLAAYPSTTPTATNSGSE